MDTKTQVDLCPMCGALVKVVSDDGTQHYETCLSQEDEAIKVQINRLRTLGSAKLVYLEAAVSEYLRRRQVLAEWAQAHDLDDRDSLGVIPG